MITIAKGVQEKETNYDANELASAWTKLAKADPEWVAQKKKWYEHDGGLMPIIPEGNWQQNKFVHTGMGKNILRHDAMIFELEPDDYVIVINAAPEVSDKNPT